MVLSTTQTSAETGDPRNANPSPGGTALYAAPLEASALKPGGGPASNWALSPGHFLATGLCSALVAPA
eukprot:12683587-Alexandrium_andersonii.AAC.1